MAYDVETMGGQNAWYSPKKSTFITFGYVALKSGYVAWTLVA
jgi:hypothetical protein